MFAYNNNTEFMKFQRDWQSEEALMRENGSDEAVITELYAFSLAVFNSNRRFYEKLDYNENTDSLNEKPEPPNCDFDNCFDILDQIENPQLLKGLKNLSPLDLKIYVHYNVDGYSKTEIAEMVGLSRQYVGRKLKKITATLKSHF